jgi:uroporphyrinogen decarboxylase
MTEKERVEALLNGKKPDRIPIWPFALNGFAVIYNKLNITDAYTNPEASYQSQLKACIDFGWVFVPFMAYAAIGAWEFSGEIRMPSGDYDQAPMVTRYPVEKEEDIHNLKWPGPNAGFYPIAARFGEMARREMLDNEPFNATISAASGYGLACNIIGAEKFFKWMIKKPKLIHDFIQSLSDWGMDQLSKKSAKIGTEGVLGMAGGATTSNQLISPEHFEEFALSGLKEGQKKMRSLGYKTTYCHICGEQNANLPYWAEIDFGDPGVIGVGHEIKLETAARYFP